MITANDWIRTYAPSLHHLEQEMNAFAFVEQKEPDFSGTARLTAPDGYITITTHRFAVWFLDRNPSWKFEAN